MSDASGGPAKLFSTATDASTADDASALHPVLMAARTMLRRAASPAPPIPAAAADGGEDDGAASGSKDVRAVKCSEATLKIHGGAAHAEGHVDRPPPTDPKHPELTALRAAHEPRFGSRAGPAAEPAAAAAARKTQDSRAAAANMKVANSGVEAHRVSRWKKFGGSVIERLLQTANLIDANYLIDLAREGGVLPRGQDVPISAIITLKNVWRLQRWNEVFSLPVFVLSYPWLDREHPDRDGVQLQMIAPMLQSLVSAAVDGSGNKHATIGVMIDYCSLPQKPFADGEMELFQAGLAEMHAWYSHPFTHTLLVTKLPPGKYGNSRPYDERGWCFFEYRTASLIKNAELLWDIKNWRGPRSYDGLKATMKIGRSPPLAPPAIEAEMRQRIEKGTLSFSYASDIEPVIAMYKRGFINAFESYREMRSIPKGAGTSIYYGGLKWDGQAACAKRSCRPMLTSSALSSS